MIQINFCLDDENILFRETTFATKLVSIFCKKEGRAYLYDVLNPLLQMLTVEAVSIEVYIYKTFSIICLV